MPAVQAVKGMSDVMYDTARGLLRQKQEEVKRGVVQDRKSVIGALRRF